jgi:hypothetical protein
MQPFGLAPVGLEDRRYFRLDKDSILYHVIACPDQASHSLPKRGPLRSPCKTAATDIRMVVDSHKIRKRLSVRRMQSGPSPLRMSSRSPFGRDFAMILA